MCICACTSPGPLRPGAAPAQRMTYGLKAYTDSAAPRHRAIRAGAHRDICTERASDTQPSARLPSAARCGCMSCTHARIPPCRPAGCRAPPRATYIHTRPAPPRRMRTPTPTPTPDATNAPRARCALPQPDVRMWRRRRRAAPGLRVPACPYGPAQSGVVRPAGALLARHHGTPCALRGCALAPFARRRARRAAAAAAARTRARCAARQLRRDQARCAGTGAFARCSRCARFGRPWASYYITAQFFSWEFSGCCRISVEWAKSAGGGAPDLASGAEWLSVALQPPARCHRAQAATPQTRARDVRATR
ncbi:hypothetical protein HYPSUDRAFT_226674 [Hypholoma sublateritium FD-334 SS-4]|uniref:Uncharacterized protein n=1 Tax=Hypholoma sublateritium (strain FD-334 SS-4) TaxID=945553 RepID=A0A0D2LNL5_HYPSF|nr:hypothetical protein HYPSUDRAFT_226674 [Hypholoma sublateritium FD-334 SS-4]